MKILHYFLGFPPFRTGGLTKFAYDLMQEQSNRNDEVSAIWPGQINLLRKAVKIVNRKNVGNIKNFEILNPLPIPFDEGIVDVDKFMESCDQQCYLNFLKKLCPDVIHIHTLMGLHKEFIEAANTLHIKTIFTTHDYFGICPKVTLFRDGDVCYSAKICDACVACNSKALSYFKIVMLQSHIYMKLKNLALVKKLRRRHRQSFFEETDTSKNIVSSIGSDLCSNYQELRLYYINMLEKIDLIHFNSSVAEAIYRQYITPRNSVLLSISNKEIVQHKNIKKTKSNMFRFTFLSPAKQFKGYTLIKNTFDRLWQEGRRDFVLNIYTAVPKVEPYMRIHDQGFSRDELASVFEQTDCLLAPSIWYETFGFTVLEALSYQTPVIISDRVGAKDIVGDNGIIIDISETNSLYHALHEIKKICISNTANLPIWENYVTQNQALYKT